MQFATIVGQESFKHIAVQLVNQHHMPHAVMIHGTEGSGGLAIARAWVQYLMCTDKKETDSCGECPSCVKVSKMQHPDVHYSFPTIRMDKDKSPPTSNDLISQFREFTLEHPYGNDKDWLESLGEEKQGNITAAECRSIIQKLNLRSFENGYKFLIMWYPEYLGSEGNILLKLIEEPTPKTILIFVSSNIDNVLGTILSRTQLFPLKRLTHDDIKNALISKYQLDTSKANQIALLADGNFNEAIKMLTESADDINELLRNWLNFIYTQKGVELSDWCNIEVQKHSKEIQKQLLEYFLQLLEHLVRYQLCGAQAVPLSEQELKIIGTLSSKGLNGHYITRLEKHLSDAIFHLARNANSKILFHSLSLRIQEVALTAQKAVLQK